MSVETVILLLPQGLTEDEACELAHQKVGGILSIAGVISLSAHSYDVAGVKKSFVVVCFRRDKCELAALKIEVERKAQEKLQQRLGAQAESAPQKASEQVKTELISHANFASPVRARTVPAEIPLNDEGRQSLDGNGDATDHWFRESESQATTTAGQVTDLLDEPDYLDDVVEPKAPAIMSTMSRLVGVFGGFGNTSAFASKWGGDWAMKNYGEA